ncbi:MAG: hypothetical protein ICV52_18950 [Microcoleus sp. C1-bin4]|nr:hypothetical protein [Microcoleus sp. C1-bin4]
MAAIETIFLYRTFLCLAFRRGGWGIRCTTTGYTYPGKEGGATEAKKKVDYFLDLRYGKRADREQP